MIPNFVLNRQLIRTFLSQNCQRGFSSSSILLNDRKTLYDDLNLEPTASSKDIKNAFIKLSKEFHPDKNPDDPEAASKFFEITNAYNTLGNPKLRRAYDRGQLGRFSSVADRDSAAHQFEGQGFVDVSHFILKTLVLISRINNIIRETVRVFFLFCIEPIIDSRFFSRAEQISRQNSKERKECEMI